MKFDPVDMFQTMHPGFFETEYIRSLNPETVCVEQILDLHTFSPADVDIPCPGNITFGLYKGDIALLHEAIRSVEEDWTAYYHQGDRIYCAFDGEKIVSFCLVDDFGTYHGLRIGGPGCVGTIPEYRKQGIGLKMVQNATALLQELGYDYSHIHFTGIGHWYARLGYQTFAKWNRNGIIEP